MHGRSLLTFLVLIAAVVANRCPNKKKLADFMQKFVVKNDPFLHINGFTFSDVWTKEAYMAVYKCTYAIYTKQSDGRILQEGHEVDKQYGVDSVFGTDYLEKTNRIGVFMFGGPHSKHSKLPPLTAKMYVFHSDENVFGYYSCQDNGWKWDIAIQVKAESRGKLLPESGDNEVKKSIVDSKKKMFTMMKWFDEPIKETPLESYPVEDICP